MDSRCPKDAVCVWAGTVSVILQMDNQFKITLELGKQKDTTYNSQNFSFTLMEVIPYPMAHPSVSVYDTTVLVRIIKQ